VRPALAAAAAALFVLASGCGPRTLRLPQGPGEPFPGFQQAFAAAAAGCRDVRTLTAEASVSGTVGRGKIRGRVLAGFERPGRIRLEGVAPIGAPVFILAADAGRATLLMPRAREVLTGQPPELVLEALVGVSLSPDVLLAVLSGCVAPDPEPTAGSRYSEGWARVDLNGGATAFLREIGGRWRILAGTRPLVALEYEVQPADQLPRSVRLRAAADGGPGANLRITLSQVEVNAPLDPKAFTVAVPAGSMPITLSELKQGGVMGERQ
jgi:outer membrane lipoprotein-sorting protein